MIESFYFVFFANRRAIKQQKAIYRKSKKRRAMTKLPLLLIVLVALMVAAPAANAQAAVFTFETNVPLQIFATLSQNDGTMVNGVVIDIEDNYQNGPDILLINYRGGIPISTKWEPAPGILNIYGRATVGQYTEILKQVFFKSSSTSNTQRRITWNFGTDNVFISRNLHLYQYFPMTFRPSFTWQRAQQACQSLTNFGMKGYLATLLYDWENNAVQNKLNYKGWLGGNDAVSEKEWRWVTGPEGTKENGKGVRFFGTYCGTQTQRQSYKCGFRNLFTCWRTVQVQKCGLGPTTIAPYFTKWNPGEPNNVRTPWAADEDYLQNGHYGRDWNDIPPNFPNSDGYLCEFGEDTAVVQPYKWYGEVIVKPGCSRFTDASACDANVQCRWDGNLPAGQKCGASKCWGTDDIAKCNNNRNCFWNTATDPDHCDDRYCAKYTDKSSCSNDNKCLYDDEQNFCTDKICNLMNQCTCGKNTDLCYWNPQAKTAGSTTPGLCADLKFAACPPIDLLFVIDGSGSFRYPFAGYRNGFLGTIETVRSWSQQATLTGHDWNFGDTPAEKAELRTAGGFRLGIIQFGRSNCANIYRANKQPGCVTPSQQVNRLTDNHFTGKLSEFSADLTWNEKNFLNDWTNLRPGLDLALTMFSEEFGRQKVMLIICDGGLTDQGAVVQARQRLLNSGVKIFALIINGPAASYAANSLKQVVTQPPVEKYYMVLNINDIRPRVLDVFCDPKSVFGSQLAPADTAGMCAKITDATTCNKDNSCLFDTGKLKCVVSPCVPYCTEKSCTQNFLCSWNPQGTGFCRRKMCDGLTQAACNGLSQICQWDQTASTQAGQFCRYKYCIGSTTVTACRADFSSPAGCQWNTIVYPAVCTEKLCTYGAASDCNKDLYCHWETSGAMSTARPSGLNLLVNSDFEDLGRSPVSYGQWGTTDIPGWTEASTAGAAQNPNLKVEWQYSVVQVPRSGRILLELDAHGSGNECIRQVVKLTANKKYRLLWWYFSRTGTSSSALGVYVTRCPNPSSCEGALTAQPAQKYDGTGLGGKWQSGSYDFTALPDPTLADPSYRIEFCGEGRSDGVGALLDATSLTLLTTQVASPPACREDKCAKYNLTVPRNLDGCRKDDNCLVNTKNQCEEKWCISHFDEKVCEADPMCEWDSKKSPAQCKLTYCAQYLTNSDCDGDRECAWDRSLSNPQTGSSGVCVEHKCSYERQECECAAIDHCFWANTSCKDERYYNCPMLDVVILLDASTSMAGPSGGHSVAFAGVTDAIRGWLNDVPMTETPAGADASSSTGVRVSIVQFGSSSAARVSPYTNGALTGSLTEINLDIDWHENNNMKADANIKIGLQTAITIFKASPASRSKVVLILADGMISDYKDTNVEETTLEKMKVKIVGVGLRTDDSIPLDQQAADSIRGLLTVSADGYTGTYIEDEINDLRSDVFDSMCKPTSFIGRVLGQQEDPNAPCNHYDNKASCARRNYCQWENTPICKGIDQCPNLDCKTPFKGFQCEKCQLKHGLVQCDAKTSFTVLYSKSACDTTMCLQNCYDNCKSIGANATTNDPPSEACIQSTCNSVKGCTYDTTAKKCFGTRCQYSTSAACASDPDKICFWDPAVNPPRCRVDMCGEIKGEIDCKARINSQTNLKDCLWDISVSPAKCVANPCPFTSDKSCSANSDTCKWDTNLNPAICRRKYCIQHKTEAQCDADGETDCDWDDSVKPAFCREKYCNYNKNENCVNDKMCVWTTGLKSVCRVRLCTYTNQNQCEIDTNCLWKVGTPSTCEERPCVQIGDEASCNRNSTTCHWDVEHTPSICRQKKCSRKGTSETKCNALFPECTWVSQNSTCREKTCSESKLPCDCAKDKRCLWNQGQCQLAQNVGCAELDLIFIVDGSKSMSKKFSRHPNGFSGLSEIFRDWVEAAEMISPSTLATDGSKQPGLRVGFIQTDNIQIVKTTSTGSQGGLTGDRATAQVDISYIEDNYLKGNGTKMAAALQDAVATLRRDGPTRKKAVVMLVPDAIQDAKSSNTVILDGRSTVNGASIEFFGIVLRPQPVLNPTSDDAYKTLQQVLAGKSATLYLKSLLLDEVRTQVLQTVCESSKFLGSQLNATFAGCDAYGDQDSCNLNPGCDWDPTIVETCPNEKGCPNVQCYEMEDADIRAGLTCTNCAFGSDNTMNCTKQTFNPPKMGDCVTAKCMETCNPTSANCADKCEVTNDGKGNNICTKLPCVKRYLTESKCDADPLCTWDPTTSPNATCRNRECITNLTKQTCETFPGCMWQTLSPASCIEKACYYTDSGKCGKDDACIWDIGANLCREAECRNPLSEMECQAAYSNTTLMPCIWDSMRSPAKCREDACVGNKNQIGCENSKCVWVPTDGWFDDCDGETKQDCTAETRAQKCKWDGSKCISVARCRENRCTSYSTAATCNANKLCTYNSASTRCEEKPCVDKLSIQACESDLFCKWDATISPAVCDLKDCASKPNQNESACTASKGCAFTPNTPPTQPSCKPKPCQAFNLQCDCEQNDDRCNWGPPSPGAQEVCRDDKFYGCPSTDLLFLLDGSGSMNTNFGRYSNGFYGMLSVLKDWVNDEGEPFTGTPASQQGASMNNTSGFRAGFVQFSRSNAVWCPKSGYSGSTGCLLSGKVSELNVDLDAQRGNFMRSSTYIVPGIDEALSIFSRTPASIRRRVLIILSDGALHDSASSTRDRSAKLAQANVEVFVVVMRKGQQPTVLSQAAEKSLKPLASSPTSTHFLNIPLDDLRKTVMEGLCDARSTFGAALATTLCFPYRMTRDGYDQGVNSGSFSGLTAAQAQTACSANPNCNSFSFSGKDNVPDTTGSGVYMTSTAGVTKTSQYVGFTKCPPGLCSTTLTGTTCAELKPACFTLTERPCNTWSHCQWFADKKPTCPTTDGCFNMGCAEIPSDYRRAGMQCHNCQLVDKVVQCRKDFNNPIPLGVCTRASCAVRCAAECNLTLAEANTTCVWDNTAKTCSRKVCNYNDDTCKNDRSCLLDPFLSVKCRIDRCARFSTQAQCPSLMCSWIPSAKGTAKDPNCIERKCGAPTSTLCPLDPDCTWDTALQSCKLTPCNFPAKDSCDASSGCEWDTYNTGNCIVSKCKNTTCQDPTCQQQGALCVTKLCDSLPDSKCTLVKQCFIDNTQNTINKCRMTCTAKYTTRTTCNNDARCDWDEQSNECVRNCLDYKSSTSECTADSRCELNKNGTCEERCSEYPSTTTCTGDSKCAWSSASNPQICVTKCTSYISRLNNATACIGDYTCMLIAQGSTQQCVDRCELQPQLQTQQACTPSYCEWNSLTKVCTQKVCNYNDQSTCTIDEGCKWQGGICRRKCDFWYDNATCLADNMCAWDASKNDCNPKCSSISLQSNCTAVAHCIWDRNNYCRDKCKLKYGTNAAACNTDKNCDWDNAANQCIELPCDADNADGCAALMMTNTSQPDHLCAWSSTSRRIQDLSYSGKQQCKVIDLSSMSSCSIIKFQQSILGIDGDRNLIISIFPGDTCSLCPWNPKPFIRCNTIQALHYKTGRVVDFTNFPASDASGAAVVSSYPIKNAPGNKISIYWTDLTNTGKPATGQIVLETSCLGACKKVCSDYNFQVDCEDPDRTEGCDWDPILNQCRRVCSDYSDPTNCTLDSFCQWFPLNTTQKCQPDCTHRQYTTEATCEADTQCMWAAKDNLCVTKCSQKRYDQCTYPQPVGTTSQPDLTQCSQFKGKTCDVKCEIRDDVVNADKCNAEPNCMWDVRNKVCTKDCTSYENQDNCTTATLGGKSGMCEWIGSSCKKVCGQRYTTPAACDTNKDPDCKWDTVNSLCTPACSRLTENATCSADKQCNFIGDNATSATCKPACELRGLTSASACAASGNGNECQWDVVRGNCYARCDKIYNIDDCRHDVACEWTGTCTQNCRNRFATQTTCITATQCEWDSTAVPAVCKNKCDAWITQGDCNTDNQCEWNGTKCLKTCSAKYDTPADRDKCLQDSTCSWNSDLQRCTKACSLRVVNTTCQPSDTCYWNDWSQSCKTVEIPAILNFGFTKDTVAAGGMVMEGLRMQCDSSRSSSLSKLITANCPIGQVIRVAPLGVKYFTTSVAFTDNCQSCLGGDDKGAIFEVWATSTTNTTYFLVASSSVRTCNATVDPELLNVTMNNYATIKLIVRPLGSNTCVSVLWGDMKFCQNRPAQCMTKCPYRWTDSFDCSKDVDCMWDDKLSKCKQTCEKIPDASCLTDSMCELNANNKCRRLCSNLPVSSCDLDPDCLFDVKDGKCKKECDLNTVEAPCTADTRCEWRKASSGTGNCATKCTELGTSTLCASDTTCKWNTNKKECRQQCTLNVQQDVCMADVQCDWVKNSCVQKCPLKWTQQNDCDFDQQCMWDNVTKTCDKTCQLLTQQECVNDAMCEWTGDSPGTCQKICTFRNTDATACDKDGSCMWDTSRPACVKNCELFATRSECGTLNMCEWDNDYIGKCLVLDGAKKDCGFKGITKDQCLARGCCYEQKDVKDTQTPWCYLKNAQCRPSCQYRYRANSTLNTTEQSRCDADQLCKWSVDEGRCKNDCAAHGLQATNDTDKQIACLKDSLCDWIPTNTPKCSQKCSLQYTSSETCATSTGCMWKASVQTCTKRCSLLSQTECNVESMCEWDGSGSAPICKLKCVFAYNNQPNCEGDSRCLWDPAKNTCSPLCSKLDSTTCDAMSRCEYYTVGSSCRLKCTELKQQLICEKDAACDWEVAIGSDNKPNKTQPQKCEKSCEFRYAADKACNADPDCMWDNKNNYCKRTCLRINTAELTTLTPTQVQAQCTSDGMCEMKNDTCFKKCLFRYSDLPSCEADSDCKWDPMRNACSKKCKLNTVEADCKADPMCEFKATDVPQTCVPQCVYRHTNETKCLADKYKQCDWDYVNQKCKNSCKMHNTTLLCKEDTTCEWLGGSCKKTCELKYSQEQSCNADTNCNWDADARACRKACPLITTTAECNAATGRCVWVRGSPLDSWNSTNLSPQPQCKAVCRYRWIRANNTKTACNRDPTCMYDNLIQQCRPVCDDYSSDEKKCNADNMCEFRTITNACKRKCFENTRWSQCTTDKQCEWLPTNECKNKCPFRQSTQIGCNTENDCMWDAALSQCKKSCERNSQGRCLADKMCIYDNSQECVVDQAARVACGGTLESLSALACTSSRPGKAACCYDASKPNSTTGGSALGRCYRKALVCKRQCRFRYTTSTVCDADPDCMWDTTRNSCARLCSTMSDLVTCSNEPTCEFFGNKCQKQCPYRHSRKETCNNSTDCKWDDMANLCKNSCSKYGTNSSKCNADTNCEFTNKNICEFKCNLAYTDGPNCEQDSPRCMWDKNLGQCKKNCVNFKTASECVDDMCEYDTTNIMCKKRCAFRTNDRTTCNKDPQCQWDVRTLACKPSCNVITRESDCNSQNECEFDTTAKLCQLKCNLRNDTTACTQWSRCEYHLTNNAGCMKTCSNFDNAQSCEGSIWCMWSNKAGNCRRRCDAYTNAEFPNATRPGPTLQEMCVQDTMCEMTKDGCKKKCEFNYLQEGPCAADPDCKWDNKRGQCTKACKLLTNPVACTQDPTCEFSRSKDQCILQCLYKYPLNQSGCIADKTCAWDSEKAECKTNCDRYTVDGGAEACKADRLCMWDNDTLPVHCRTRCSTLYPTAAERTNCTNDAKCMWDGANLQCDTTCSELENTADCTAEDVCSWDTNKNKCVKKCPYRWLDRPSCDLDTECMWDTSKSTCKKTCSMLNKDACVIDPMCDFALGANKCRKKCSALDSQDKCVTDPICEWMSATRLCKNKCQTRYAPGAQDACDRDSECMFDVSKSECQPICTRIPIAQCAQYGMCISSIGTCRKTCQFQYSTQRPCDSDPNCMWDIFRGRCSALCDLQTTSDTCLSSAICEWYHGECKKQCQYRYADKGNCSSDVQCEWDPVTDATCRNSCKRYVPKANMTLTDARQQCEADSMCLWQNGVCVKECNIEFNDPTSCNNATDRCMWNPVAQVCTKRCENIDNELTCGTNKDICLWNAASNKCEKLCKFRYTTEKPCDQDGACMWDNAKSVCKPHCSQIKNTQSCIGDSDCDWDTTDSKCKEKCGNINVNGDLLCQTPRCEYGPNMNAAPYNSSCRKACATSYFTKGDCDKDMNCMWDPTSNLCKTSCAAVADLRLISDVSTKLPYVPALLGPEQKSSKCTAVPECEWEIQNATTLAPGLIVNYFDLSSPTVLPDFTKLRSFKTDIVPNIAFAVTVGNFLGSGRSENLGAVFSGWIIIPTSGSWVFFTNSDDGSRLLIGATGSIVVNNDGLHSMRELSGPITLGAGTYAFRVEFFERFGHAGLFVSWQGPGVSKSVIPASSFLRTAPVGICEKKCLYRHTTTDACTSDVECDWDVERNVCTDRCDQLTVDSACKSSTMCEWKKDSNQCLKKCIYRFRGQVNKDACNAAMECEWNNVTLQCKNKCSYHIDFNANDTAAQKGDCNADNLCEWNPMLDPKCQKKCSILYSFAKDCNTDPKCMWNSGTTSCMTECSLLAPSDCMATTDCIYRLTSLPTQCKKLCSTRYISAAGTLDKTACSVDKECQLNDENCEMTCTDRAPAACTQSTMCELRNTVNNQCQKKCTALMTNSTCLKDVTCDWVNGKCNKKCELRFTDGRECDAESTCMYEKKTTTCKKNCALLSADVCASDNMCEYDTQASICKKKCNFLYTNQDSCELDANCQWDTVRGQCNKNCDMLKSQLDCTSDSMCEWQGGICKKMCVYRHKTQSKCDPDPECEWNNNTMQCKNSCDKYTKNGGKDACVADKFCLWDTDNTCKKTCPLEYSDRTSCDGDARCMWDASFTSCKKNCKNLLAQSECDLESGMCTWDRFTASCKKQCQFRHTQSATCNADSNCMWDTTKSSCKVACGNLATDSVCEADPDCDWDKAKGICKKTCNYLGGGMECANDLWCEIEASFINNSRCIQTCNIRYAKAETCAADPDCMWNAAENQCKRACSSISKLGTYDKTKSATAPLDASSVNLLCVNNAMCRPDATAEQCNKICMFRYPTVDSCNAATAECMWDSQRKMCNKKCELLMTVGDCLGDGMCEWDISNTICEKQCMYRWGNATTCNADGDCMWSKDKGLCQQKCNRYPNATSCNADPLCEFGDTTCAQKCELEYTSEKDCQNDPARCMWNPILGMCKQTCTLKTSAKDCSAQTVCAFLNNTCKKDCKYRGATNNDTCKPLDECMWDNSKTSCENDCTRLSLDQCVSQSKCRVDGTTCKRQCSSRGLGECTADPTCTVGANINGTLICKQKCEFRYSNYPSCEGDKECMWDAGKATCVRDCTLVSVPNCLSSSSQCQVDGSTCTRRCQYRTIDPATCDASLACQWDRNKKICNRLCDLYKSVSECNVDGMCEWFQGTCQKQCSYRYVNAVSGQTNQTKCDADTDCKYDQYSAACRNTCSKYNTTAVCNADPYCDWTLNTCTQKCELEFGDDSEKCKAANTRCMFDGVKGKCTKTCNLLASQTECSVQSTMCWWDGARCKMQCSKKYTNVSDCDADPSCMWDIQVKSCKPHCSRTTDPAACGLIRECEWDKPSQSCMKQCVELNTDNKCNADSRCVYDRQTTTCLKKCVLKYSTEPTCNGDSNCM